jgi:uncharacterized protein YukE
MALLLPNPGDLLALARRIDAVAGTTRRNGERLRSQLAGTHWSGPAARAFELQADLVLHALCSAADRLDGAADALRSHADAVDSALKMVKTTLGLGWDLATGVLGEAFDAVGL